MNDNIQKWNSPKTVIIILGLLLLTGVITLSILRDRFVSRPEWQVSFTGRGKVVYKPDTAKLNLGVTVDKKAKAEEALSELNRIMDKVITDLTAAGIVKDKISTQSYVLAPQYDFIKEKNELAGYTASQNIIVEVNDIDDNPNRVATVISAAGKAGANQVNGISFEPSDLEKLKEEARLKAIADARVKADALSGNLGVKLKRVVGWWENIYPVGTQPYYYGDYGGGKGGAGGFDPNIPSGMNEIVVEVNINYQIR